MPIFKAVNESYKTTTDLHNLICYVVRESHCIGNLCGAQGLRVGTGANMYEQMYEIKKYFRKEDKRQALHYILSFSEEEEKYIGIREAMQIGYEVANFFQGWQVVFGVHTNSERLHIHFVVNGTSYENGRGFSMDLQLLQRVPAFVRGRIWDYYYETLSEEEKKQAIYKRLEEMANPYY